MGAASKKKQNYSSTDSGKALTWIRKEHYKLDMIHYMVIFSLLGGMILFGGLLIMSYIDLTRPLVASFFSFFT